MNEEIPIEPAATLVLVRDSHEGPQVLMQQRNPNAVFVGGAWVFPGGKLDPDDSHPCWRSLVGDFDEDKANGLLDVETTASPYNLDQINANEAALQHNVSALAYWIAALREAYEEAGLLLSHQPLTQTQRDNWRSELLAETLTWKQLVEREKLTLDIEQIHYLSHWITPPENPRRYDTRFFITIAPPDQEPSHEDYEAIETRWLTPQAALDACAQGEMTLIFPTFMTLKAMCGFEHCDALLESVLAHFNT